MKKIICLFFLFSFSFLFAQREVTGQITDASGSGLSGVKITAAGSKTVVSTDGNGNFTIKASIGSILGFNYLGFKWNWEIPSTVKSKRYIDKIQKFVGPCIYWVHGSD